MGAQPANRRRHHSPRSVFVATLVSLGVWGLVACGADRDSNAPRVLRVEAGGSIQEVVDSARRGDMVLVAPGTYHEEVVIDTPGVTLRGEDRNTVVLDGESVLNNGVFVSADGVSVENLTVHHYGVNGVVFSGVSEQGDISPLDGFRMAYLTAYDNGLYGLYAFQASNGVIEHSYASGHPDSGIYVGQCGRPEGGGADLVPCNVVVRDVIAEYNAVGYEGTNSSQVWVIESVFRNNRVGITPNSQSLEYFTPQTETIVAGNLVLDNNEVDAPEQASGAIGLGIAVGSGTDNLIIRNRVVGHARAGIAITVLDEFTPAGNRVEGNIVDGNAVDLAYWQFGGTTERAGNCFVDNTFGTSMPADIETVLACDGGAGSLEAPVVPALASPDGPRYSDVPAPPAQPTMPGDVTLFGLPPRFELPSLADIVVPDLP